MLIDLSHLVHRPRMPRLRNRPQPREGCGRIGSHASATEETAPESIRGVWVWPLLRCGFDEPAVPDLEALIDTDP